MKYSILIIAVLLAIGTMWQCASTKIPPKAETIGQSGDSTEYDLVVMDPNYDLFLLTQAKPMNYYSLEYYKSWNTQYVAEWNARCRNPIVYGSFYVTPIDYSPFIDYGLEFNYKLFYYFVFIDKEYKIKLLTRPGI